MHPAIREFPSLNFYGGGLRDGPGVAQDTRRPWHACPAFQPLVFIDVKGTVGGLGGVCVVVVVVVVVAAAVGIARWQAGWQAGWHPSTAGVQRAR